MTNIRPITDLRKTNEISDLCHNINEPIFITKNGYSDLVIMSNEYYKNVINQNSISNNYIKDSFIKDEQPTFSNIEDACLGMIKVAAINFDTSVANVEENTSNILLAIERAKYKEAKIVVFPELAITGYTCGDLFLSSTLKIQVLKSIDRIKRATIKNDALIFIGAPLSFNDKLYNCAIAFHKGNILGIIPKTAIPNYTEFYEARYFESAPENNSYVYISNEKIPFGNKLLFQNIRYKNEIVSCEICEDLWVPNSPSIKHAAAGATITVNLSASNEVIGKEEYRNSLVSSTSAKYLLGYIYCSASNQESTTDVLFSGANIIAENGTILAKNELFEKSDLYTELDLDRIVNERNKMNSYPSSNKEGFNTIYFSSELKIPNITRKYSPTPFIPVGDKNKMVVYNKILKMQALGLVKRLRHAKIKNLVLGISGGLDSTLALLAANLALTELDLSPKALTCITMPCFGTSSRTYNNAKTLVEGFGNVLKSIDISEAVELHLKDIGHELDNYDITFENAQARERTQVLMDYANQINGLVIGTGDLSEMALGWSTYNGDHMSMYAINCSIPKTLIRDMIRYLAPQYPLIKETLLDILDTPVSPELIPIENDTIQQKTEDVVGPYELHDFFLYYFIRNNFSMSKIFFLAKLAFKDKYNDDTIKYYLRYFIKRFFTQQFKRSCTPDGIKVGTVSLSPRGDWRMPSDASMNTFIQEIDKL